MKLRIQEKDYRIRQHFLSKDMLGLFYLSLLFCLGISESLLTALDIHTYGMLPILVGASVVVCGICVWTSFWNQLRWLPPLLCVVISVLVSLGGMVLTGASVQDGYVLCRNQAAEVLQRQTGRIYLERAISVDSHLYGYSILLFLLIIVSVWAVCSVYLVIEAHFVFPLILSIGIIIGITILGIQPNVWYLLIGFALSLQMVRYLTKQTNTRDGGRMLLSSGLGLFCIVGICAAVIGLAGKGENEENGSLRISERLQNFIEDIRFGQAEDGLTNGRFIGLGALERRSDTVLEVTMSEAESLYLRGFIGEYYTGYGWEKIDNEQKSDYADTFYWLYKSGFYGQSQLAQMAQTADKSLTKNSENCLTITVNNQQASRKYYYTPYELLTVENILNTDFIEDSAIWSRGLTGEQSYTYQSLTNQVKNYQELLMKLSQIQDNSKYSDKVNTYLKEESRYQEYVYQIYTQLPESTKQILEKDSDLQFDLGEDVNFYQVKEEILSYLSGHMYYNETPKTYDAQEDFLTYLLEDNRTGYDVHYASAATLLFRYYGIPARYVEGYLITPKMAEQGSEKIAITGEQAHAWVETYIDGAGWIPCEVTPTYIGLMEQSDYKGNGSSIKQQKEQKEQSETEKEQEKQELSTASDWNLTMVLPWIVIIGIFLLLLLLLWSFYVLYKRYRKKQNLWKSFYDADNKKAVSLMFAYTVRVFRLFGLEYRNGNLSALKEEIVKEFGSELAEEFCSAMELNEAALFSARAMTKEEQTKMLQFLNHVLSAFQEKKNIFQRFYWKDIQFLY